MAIIRTNKNGWLIPAVIEDPRPQGDLMFIFGDGHNKNTLSKKWDSTISFNTAGNTVSNWGTPSYSVSPTVYRSDHVFYLSKETVHVTHISTTINSVDVLLDITAKTSMDPDNPCNTYKYILDAATGDSVIYGSSLDPRAAQTLFYFTRFNHQGSLDTSFPTKNTSIGSFGAWPCWWNPSTKNLIALTSASGTYPYLTNGPGRIQNLMTGPGVTSLTFTFPAHVSNNTHQFIGVDSTGQSVWLRNAFANDYTQTILRYDDAANTLTTLFTFSAIPPAGGTSAGGNRGNSFLVQPMKFASKTFDNPASAGNKAFYAPYLDVVGAYHPLLFTWNRTTDVYERFTDITVNWGSTNQNDVWQPDSTTATAVNSTTCTQRFVYNEVLKVLDDENNERLFLTFFQTQGTGVTNDADQRRRTVVNFEIDQTDPKVLTYHSHTVIPRTIKNNVWLNDERTILGIVTWDNFYIYNFNPEPGIGWQLSADLPYRFESVGRDSLGRIWAVDGGPFNYGRVHIITPSVPAVIKVTLAENNYNFTGTVINSTGTVEAFGASGERLEVDVRLRVVGTSLRIINDSEQEVTELVVQTSSAEAVSFNIRVKSAGNSSIIASLEI
jgi:hypothetical protein